MERALARARAVAKADRERKAGRWLAVVPLGIGALLLLLMMPRATVPEAIPIPRVDERVLRRSAHDDDVRAAAAETTRLPTQVLAVGSAFRALNEAQARDATEAELIDAHRVLDAALRELGPDAKFEDDLCSLRALQTRHFLDAVEHWEATGETSDDLRALGGDFIRRLEGAGWATKQHVLLSEHQRRIMFKTVWNAVMRVEARPAFSTTLDEQRALYAFYIAHPHPPENRRELFEQQRREATTPLSCARANAEERRQTEMWRVDKIRKLAQIDAEYPGAFALGVAYYRAGRYDLSIEAFNAFIHAHPDGRYAILARNHLKAALVAHGTL